MVQVKVKKFSRSKTEIQPQIQPEYTSVNEENEEIKENEEEVNEVPKRTIIKSSNSYKLIK